MRKKTPGKLNKPPPQDIFDLVPLRQCCGRVEGVFYRLHSIDAVTGAVHAPVHFSRNGANRFDPPDGPGTLYVGETLSGVLMEIFDDRWGPVGDITRSLTETELRDWHVTLIALPTVTVFLAQDSNLSKIGTDFQLISGDHVTSREWALRLIRHPARIEGIFYPSRHNTRCCNIALFRTRRCLPERQEKSLVGSKNPHSPDLAVKGGKLVYGPPIRLGEHPELPGILADLEIAILP
jgi:hypothetical protein